jgi:hypothetical protein
VFLVLYTLFSLFAFLGRDLRKGSHLPRCADPECRYDLTGLDEITPCPECASIQRERTPDHYDIVLRPHALVPWCVTLAIVIALLSIDDYTLALFARLPMYYRDHFLYRGRVIDAEINPLFLAAACTPLAAKLLPRWRSLTTIALIMLAGYTTAARIASRL